MKKPIICSLVLGLLVLGRMPCPAQEPQSQTEVDILKASPEKATYDPAGRRDPFKNLLSGKDVREKTSPGGTPQISIDDIRLIGIVMSRQKLTAIVSGPHGFPQFIHVGDKFADGYVLSIKDSQVVFRKTKERGVPLMRPNDIVKEITPEER
jgi:Tfp pilus assembly protein PilP